MTTEKIISVMEIYYNRLHPTRPIRNGNPYEHLRWMCYETINLAQAGRTEKAFRWLGFVQGVLWVWKFYTLDELKVHSMPDWSSFRR